MTRVYFQAGRLRLRVILIEALVLALFGLFNIAGYAAFFHMPPEQLRWQTQSFALLIGVVFVALALYSWRALRPVAMLLDDLREKGVAAARDEESAQRAALRFPLHFSALALAVSAGALAVGLAADVLGGGLELSFAVALAFATATELLVTCAAVYILLRALLRPIVAHFRHEQVPPGIRISINAKVTYTIVALCLAVAIPTALICSVHLRTVQSQAHAERRELLARALAHGGPALDAEARARAIAAVRLSGEGRIRLEPTPAPGSAPLPDGKHLSVVSSPREPQPHTYLVVLVVLLLGVSTFVGRKLGSNMAQNVELVSSQVRQLAEALPLAEKHQLRPLIAEVPQYTDLRRLADALNELLERIVEISVTHFLAIEKTLEADRVKTLFMANVSHDLRSPLNSVIGFSQLLLKDADQLNSRQRQDLETTLRCGNELLLLINQVLDSAKIDAGRIALHREDSLPAELLSTTLKELQREGVTEAVTIDTELQPGMQAVLVDPQRFVQAMINVIRFCARSVDGVPDGRIVVQLKQESQPDRKLLIFRAATTAGGLPERDLQHLFHGFRRRPGRRGLGLELPLARSLVELHDGTLAVTSSVGMGTTFTATIPLLQPRVLARLRPRKDK